FNDATTQDLTGTASWLSSDITKATMAGNVATGVAAGPVTITVTGVSADGSNVSASTALNVVATSTIPPLNGSYAFTLMSADTRGPQFFAGSFIVDGSGNVTAGVEDANTGSGIFNDSLTGSYTSYPDGRGTIRFNPNAIHPNGIALRYIMASGGNIGKFIE